MSERGDVGCYYCSMGIIRDSTTDVKAWMKDGLKHIIGVPARVCDVCGESFLIGSTARILERTEAERAPYLTKTYKEYQYADLEALNE